MQSDEPVVERASADACWLTRLRRSVAHLDLSDCTVVSSRSPYPRCPCRSPHHRVPGSARRSCCLGVHWVRPEMVVEVYYVEMTPDGLLRHVVYLGEREDKPARDVIRSRPT